MAILGTWVTFLTPKTLFSFIVHSTPFWAYLRHFCAISTPFYAISTVVTRVKSWNRPFEPILYLSLWF